MIMEMASAALAENAIEIRYDGDYDYASAVCDDSGGAASSPLISLGVSNTSLAAAVSAAQTVYTGTSTGDIQEVIAKLGIWYDTTAAREVFAGDFKVRQFNSLLNDSIYHASAAKFEDDAGTTNLKNTWTGFLTWDNNVDSTGFVTLRIPTQAEFNNVVAVKELSGHSGTSGTPTLTRTIYNAAGTSKWSSGATATATSALMLKTFAEPVMFGGPIIVRDTAGTVGHLNATTMSVMFANVSQKERG